MLANWHDHERDCESTYRLHGNTSSNTIQNLIPDVLGWTGRDLEVGIGDVAPDSEQASNHGKESHQPGLDNYHAQNSQ